MVIPPNQTDTIFNNADFGQKIRSILSLAERPTLLQMKQVKKNQLLDLAYSRSTYLTIAMKLISFE